MGLVERTQASKNAPVEHRVERRDLVHTHGVDLNELRDVVHDGDRGPSELFLAEVKQGDDGGFLVLWRVFRDNVLRLLQVLGCELERNLHHLFDIISFLLSYITYLRIIVVSVPVL